MTKPGRGKRKYRRNPAWATMRANHLLAYPECRHCGTVEPTMHVHHIRYRGKRGESELPGDLVTLCPDCHMNKLHGGKRGAVPVKDNLKFLGGSAPTKRTRFPERTIVAIADGRDVLDCGHQPPHRSAKIGGTRGCAACRFSPASRPTPTPPYYDPLPFNWP